MGLKEVHGDLIILEKDAPKKEVGYIRSQRIMEWFGLERTIKFI